MPFSVLILLHVKQRVFFFLRHFVAGTGCTSTQALPATDAIQILSSPNFPGLYNKYIKFLNVVDNILTIVITLFDASFYTIVLQCSELSMGDHQHLRKCGPKRSVF